MTKRIPQFLLENFPDRSELSYEDFTLAGADEPAWLDHSVECYAYDYDKELADRAFRIISRPWPEIDWFEIGRGGWMVPGFLNRKSFIHAFPSLLNYLCILTQSRFENLKKDGNLLSSGFVETLDLNHLKHLEKEIHGEGAFDWRREFYFSLPDEVKKTIALILRMEMDWGDALESYWSAFRDTLTTAKPISTRHEWVRPDFTLGNLGLAFRRIEAGRFTMRSYPDIEKGIFSDETPAHTVCISKPFYLGQFPVTQAQWLEVMNENPSFFVRNDDHPVDSVSWDKAQAFIAKLNTPSWWNDKPEAYRELQQFIARLNEETGLREDTGYIFRLPIEAEWEYACRAVSESDPERETKERWRWFFGDDPSDLEHYAWYGGNAGMTTHPVGEKRPNPWGLYDMLGNVWEWAWCRFKDYQNEVVIDPMEDIGGAIFRRGGSWFLPDWKTRTARRLFGFYPERGDVFSGFRLALAPRLG